jgi:hypothetical protein
MASGNRTLKLSILADVDDLKKKLGEADKAVESNSDRIAEFSKKAALAFVAVGAAAGAFAIQAVKNAALDEAAQRKLEETIRASTNATEAQTAAVAEYIDKTSIAIGVTDDELRPALSRLIRSTNDVEKAQSLLNLALDITAATGKPLEAVSNALGKAYDGNATSLGRLGLGLDQSILKSKDFDLIFQNLTSTFGNFAENEAQTTEVQFKRLQIAIDEAKESIGAALLPTVTKFITYLNDTGVPALNAFIAGLTGKGGMTDALSATESKAQTFGETIKSISGFIGGFITFLKEAIGFVTMLANGIIGVINIIPGANIPSIPNIAPSFAPSIPQTSGLSSLGVNPNAPVTTVNNITVQALDSESAARAVNKVITQSSKRSIPALSSLGVSSRL